MAFRLAEACLNKGFRRTARCFARIALGSECVGSTERAAFAKRHGLLERARGEALEQLEYYIRSGDRKEADGLVSEYGLPESRVKKIALGVVESLLEDSMDTPLSELTVGYGRLSRDEQELRLMRAEAAIIKNKYRPDEPNELFRIVHLAAITTPKGGKQDPTGTIAANTGLTDGQVDDLFSLVSGREKKYDICRRVIRICDKYGLPEKAREAERRAAELQAKLG